ncbi:hypothetical protein F503_08517 [Ophiostoma piceae UAMH 11346]|uniref:Uncharacterized protein n=1 Tax=Ophiostoma piceae (strain UAMH 11346) TaxID=1262450 RepID=S3BNI5_OPHP1|nr:hypothetical protein F503_08517 [Ophiostoma piceae UAMH 11346]
MAARYDIDWRKDKRKTMRQAGMNCMVGRRGRGAAVVSLAVNIMRFGLDDTAGCARGIISQRESSEDILYEVADKKQTAARLSRTQRKPNI